MKIKVEGFEDNMKQLLTVKCKDALNQGLDAFKMWAAIVDINAELSIEGDSIIIRKGE